MTEKRKPTYDLAAFKAAFGDVDKLNVTGTAVRTAAILGFGRAEIVATIQTMQRAHFYKSMTSYGDHRVWQDVYHVPSEVGHALRKIHGRCGDRVFIAVVQGKGQ
jgi:motility quorum-sensing regulator / GCU-specific mRNA interferase toxin